MGRQKKEELSSEEEGKVVLREKGNFMNFVLKDDW